MTPETEAQLLQDIGAIKRDVADLNKSVKGNGRKGIDGRLVDVEGAVEKVDAKICDHLEDHKTIDKESKEKQAGKKEFSAKFWLLVIGVCVTNIGGWAFALFLK